ncbi:PLAC8-domain-containing protein [Meredithblackwellia eburnea MCA 4105]
MKKQVELASVQQQEQEAPPAYSDSNSENNQTSLLSRAAILATTTTSQLALTPQMSINPARNSRHLPYAQDNRREWNHNLCACHEEPLVALNAICCPCIQYSSNRSRLAHLNMHNSPHEAPVHLGLFCCLYTISPHFFGIGQTLLQTLSRVQTRQRYLIRGDPFTDLLIAGFCAPCSLVQESREIADEENELRREVGVGGVVRLGSGEEGLGLREEEEAEVAAYRDDEDRV